MSKSPFLPVILSIGFVWLNLVGCKEDASQAARQAHLARIDSLEQVLAVDPDVVKHMKTANALIGEIETFAKTYPSDSTALELLMKAGEIARGLGKYDKAIELLSMVWVKHPKHRLAPPALFLQGFIYDNDLSDSTLAVQHYREFLLRYPEHELAPQVQTLMEVVGKSPEELIKTFEQRRAEQGEQE
jgi:tetratricopeptide (TPR) repeat protein